MILELVSMCLLFLGIIWICLKYQWRKLRGQKPIISILLGSGGHTTEMCELLKKFNFNDCDRIYIISGTSDKLSEAFFVNNLQNENPDFNLSKIAFIKSLRTNQVLQSKFSSVFTTIRAFIHALVIIVRNLLGSTHFITNGPGLAIPYLYTIWFFNKIGVCKTKLIFFESWCRVKTLSLTGKLAQYVCQEYIVHWPEQKQLSKRAKYYGQII